MRKSDLLGKKVYMLVKILREMESVVLAYSGGVDSTFLLKIASKVLGKGKVLAVTAKSRTYPADEYEEARRLAKSLGVKHRVIATDELKNRNFSRNPVNRCYYCKRELFGRLKNIAHSSGYNFVIDGTNFDDRKDHRPGRRAAEELGVRSPLGEAKFKKDEIRFLSKKLGLATWDKPSLACLASRFPYHSRITKEKLSMVENAEKFLKRLQFKQVRVRHYGKLARIEIFPKDMQKICSERLRSKIVRKFKQLGFVYIDVDLQGYRTGSMNEAISRVSRV